jgi:hypothetical protein
MLDYRVYLLDEDGRVSQIPRMIRCMTDDDATRRARYLQESQGVEVWQGARLVIKIDPPQ